MVRCAVMWVNQLKKSWLGKTKANQLSSTSCVKDHRSMQQSTKSPINHFWPKTASKEPWQCRLYNSCKPCMTQHTRTQHKLLMDMYKAHEYLIATLALVSVSSKNKALASRKALCPKHLLGSAAAQIHNLKIPHTQGQVHKYAEHTLWWAIINA